MNIKAIITGLALMVVGLWCLYKGVKNWKDRENYPAFRYVVWGVFTVIMGIIVIIYGYLGYWGAY